MDPGRRRLTPVVSSRQRRWLVRCATTHRRGGCERVPNRPISTCPQPKLDDLSFGPTQVCWRDRKAIWAFTTAEPGMPTANRPSGATERQSGRSPRPSRACRRRTGRGGVGTPMCTHLPRRDHRKTAPTTPPPAAASWPAPGHLPARVAGTQAYPATSWRLGQYRTCRPTSTMRSKPPRTTRHPVPARTRHPHRGGTATDDTPALAAAEHIDLSARWPLTPTCSPAASPTFCNPNPGRAPRA